MRGDVVYRIYGVHTGRTEDVYFGTFRTREEADAAILRLRKKNGENWAVRYHDCGFVIREARVETDFEVPPRPTPRERYFVRSTPKANHPGTWDSSCIAVFRRGDPAVKLYEYERNYAPLQTFEPFRQGAREFALIARDYWRTAVLDLNSGKVIAEEATSGGNGFCPVGFYVPDWWDVHELGGMIPGSPSWDTDCEWPVGDFGFVWGCIWGDDSSWKVQHLDLRRVQDGTIVREERFGYVELATAAYRSPCFEETLEAQRRPHFIELEKYDGKTRVRFAVEIDFNLQTGEARQWVPRPGYDPFE
jgi:hypothetical protein